MSSITGVCFSGQPSTITPGAPPNGQAPLDGLATAVTQATSPAGERFVPSQWSSSLLGEERKLPCVILPPESRTDAALRQLNGLAPATYFECPKEILGYGYALFTREPEAEQTFFDILRQSIPALRGSGSIHEIIRDYVYEEEETFWRTLRRLIPAPKEIQKIIRNYVYAELPLNQQTSFEEWCDYLELDKKTKEALVKILDHLNEDNAENPTHARGIQHILDKMYIKITHLRDSLDEKSPKEKARLEKILKESMRGLINILINSPGDFANASLKILCELEAEIEFDRNPEIPSFKPLAGTILLGYSLGLAIGRGGGEFGDRIQTPAEQKIKHQINSIYEALGIETSPNFLPNSTSPFTCLSPEQFLDHYDPVEGFRCEDARDFREALLEWAIKYYTLNQYEIIEGQRVYDPLTRALCLNPEELKTRGGIGERGIFITPEAWLFLLEATGMIQRKRGKNKRRFEEI